MSLDDALAYDASPSGPLACEHWCDEYQCDNCPGGCNCGMERARAVVTTLQAEINRRKEPQ